MIVLRLLSAQCLMLRLITMNFLSSARRLSSPSPSPTTLVSQDLPIATTTIMFNTHQVVSTLAPTQAPCWPQHPSQQFNQPYHSTFSTSYSPSSTIPSFSGSVTGGGAIVFPAFVNHLVHPDVDSFKDIPKLPGQSDPPPSSADSPLSFSTTPYGLLPQEPPQTPPSYSLLHSPARSDSPVQLSEEDLQQILELNKDTMYT